MCAVSQYFKVYSRKKKSLNIYVLLPNGVDHVTTDTQPVVIRVRKSKSERNRNTLFISARDSSCHIMTTSDRGNRFAAPISLCRPVQQYINNVEYSYHGSRKKELGMNMKYFFYDSNLLSKYRVIVCSKNVLASCCDLRVVVSGTFLYVIMKFFGL